MRSGPPAPAAGRATHGLSAAPALLRPAGVSPLSCTTAHPPAGDGPLGAAATSGAAEDNFQALWDGLRCRAGARRPELLPLPRGPLPAHLVAGLWRPGRCGVRRGRRGYPGPGCVLLAPAGSARGGAAAVAGRGRGAAASERHRRSWRVRGSRSGSERGCGGVPGGGRQPRGRRRRRRRPRQRGRRQRRRRGAAEGRRRKAGRGRRKKPPICRAGPPRLPGGGAGAARRRSPRRAERRRCPASGQGRGSGRRTALRGALSGRRQASLPAPASRRLPPSRERHRREDGGAVSASEGTWAPWGASSWGAALSRAAEACRLPRRRSYRRHPTRCRGESLPARLPACFLPPSLLPPQRPGALSAPPAARSLPEAARLPWGRGRSQQRCRKARRPAASAAASRPLWWRCSRRPFGQAGEGDWGARCHRPDPPGPSGPQSAPSRPCAQSPESSSPGVAFRLCGPLGAGAATGPSGWWRAGASSPPALCCALPPAHRSSTVLRRRRPPGGEGGKGRHRLDGRAIAGAAPGPGGARTLRSGGPEEGGRGSCGPGERRFLSRRCRWAARSIRPAGIGSDRYVWGPGTAPHCRLLGRRQRGAVGAGRSRYRGKLPPPAGLCRKPQKCR